MGNVIAKAEMSDNLFNAARAFVGHVRGGIGMATALACGMFGAISGSSLATAVTMSKAAMPSMRRFGYADSLATGVIAAGGTLGILIPPSIVLIIYGIMARQDIADMFIAGIIPGLLGVLGYMIAVSIVTWLRPQDAPPAERVTWRERWRALSKIGDLLLLFLVVMGGLYLHVFTSTEAAGIGAVSALVIAAARGKISFRFLSEVAVETGQTTAMLFTIYIGALFLTSYINYSDLPYFLEDMIQKFQLGTLQVVLIILGICVLLGTVLEAFSIILLIVPIALPILVSLDVNLVWFGILLVVVTEISLITPPVGMNVFVMKSVNPDVKLSTIFKGVMPFILIDIVRLSILVAFPVLVLWLVT
jgi:tripartite ATP-independent transporter DctM subunit